MTETGADKKVEICLAYTGWFRRKDDSMHRNKQNIYYLSQNYVQFDTLTSKFI